MSKIVAVKRIEVNGELFAVDVLKSDGAKYHNLYAVDGIPNTVAVFAFCNKICCEFTVGDVSKTKYTVFTESGDKFFTDRHGKKVLIGEWVYDL